MRVLSQLPQAPLHHSFALTVGTFDGVHRGHAFLIEKLKSEAAQRGLQTAVLTFTDMPYCYFRPDECSRLLTLPDEKAQAFEPLKIDELLIVPFDKQIAEQPADEFVTRVLVEKLRLKLLVAGPDFALGKGRAGDVTALRTLGAQHGFEVVVLDEKLNDEGAISSTRIRECVEDGHMKTAARLLGRPFALQGNVISGQQLGRTIGVPTINLQVHPRKVLPANGVYAGRALFDHSPIPHRAALNIGTRPTVNGQSLSIEFHVIEENIEAPPQNVQLEIIERLRDEKKFPDLNTLVTQMQRDIARAASILSE
ncbi:MAG TPA: bifunctional riboflavin kinase/FAD synthetase [Abditibacteriaceae bacterium]|jgi:riboflavin kinase/FMN adenylyltransferase